MSDPDELLRIGKPTLELMLREAEKVGFMRAVEMLRDPSVVWSMTGEAPVSIVADWLESRKEEIK